ncbi:helix-turn-helix transcriptional regulator [Desulforegula conservatrix]|uniref:helix-turn-helix transcriptional regulator n=1 Tax=Desulforegula conservatrix TaxID=153026 RepID=UPI00040334B8|nr:hypothetical protein [Desulforegula conservatrix]
MKGRAAVKEKYMTIHMILGNPNKGIPAVIPVSRRKWLKGVESGIYPKPVRVSSRSLAWKAKDIERLVKELEDGHDKKETPLPGQTEGTKQIKQT